MTKRTILLCFSRAASGNAIELNWSLKKWCKCYKQWSSYINNKICETLLNFPTFVETNFQYLFYCALELRVLGYITFGNFSFQLFSKRISQVEKCKNLTSVWYVCEEGRGGFGGGGVSINIVTGENIKCSFVPL